jgi:hypothetical protein
VEILAITADGRVALGWPQWLPKDTKLAAWAPVGDGGIVVQAASGLPQLIVTRFAADGSIAR